MMKEYGFSKTLLIRHEDEDLQEVSDYFIKDLEKEFTKFKKEFEINELSMEKYFNNKDFIFKPEKLFKRSPLTIINGEWGSGKTYFIENFFKLMIDGKIKSTKFKKMIIIDAWKFSGSNDVSVEFSIELATKLFNLQEGNEELEDNKKNGVIKKITNTLIPKNLSWQLNFGFVSIGAEHEISKNESDEKMIDLYNDKIQNNDIPTIIFIDNIERLGTYTWDLLKTIIKFQEFDNYLIILPMNLKRISNNSLEDENEYPIEKYVDINYYQLNQDYMSFFRSKFNNPDINKELNLIFNKSINEKKLSIREVEKAFTTYDIYAYKNEYEIYKIIQKNIWPANEIFDLILQKNTKKYLDYKQEMQELYFRILRSFFSFKMRIGPGKREIISEYIDINNCNLKIDLLLNEDKTEFLPYRLMFDYSEEMIKIWNILSNNIEEQEKEFQKLHNIKSDLQQKKEQDNSNIILSTSELKNIYDEINDNELVLSNLTTHLSIASVLMDDIEKFIRNEMESIEDNKYLIEEIKEQLELEKRNIVEITDKDITRIKF